VTWWPFLARSLQEMRSSLKNFLLVTGQLTSNIKRIRLKLCSSWALLQWSVLHSLQLVESCLLCLDGVDG